MTREPLSTAVPPAGSWPSTWPLGCVRVLLLALTWKPASSSVARGVVLAAGRPPTAPPPAAGRWRRTAARASPSARACPPSARSRTASPSADLRGRDRVLRDLEAGLVERLARLVLREVLHRRHELLAGPGRDGELDRGALVRLRAAAPGPARRRARCSSDSTRRPSSPRSRLSPARGSRASPVGPTTIGTVICSAPPSQPSSDRRERRGRAGAATSTIHGQRRPRDCSSSSARRRRPSRWTVPPGAPLSPEAIAARACSSAAMNSSALAKRCAGSFSSARPTACSSRGCTSGRSARSGGGCSLTCLSAIDTALSPLNGTCAGEHLVEHHADRVEVGRRARRAGPAPAPARGTAPCP